MFPFFIAVDRHTHTPIDSLLRNIFGTRGRKTKVRSIAGHAGWDTPKAIVAGMVAALESAPATPTATGAASSTTALRFGEFVADLIIDDIEGKWWLTQVGVQYIPIEPERSQPVANSFFSHSPRWLSYCSWWCTHEGVVYGHALEISKPPCCKMDGRIDLVLMFLSLSLLSLSAIKRLPCV